MILDIDRASFGYPGAGILLNEITVGVSSGEIVGIRGRSGCGKSTLLALACGFLRPSTGAVLWQGKTRPAPGSVGMVFQDAAGSLNPRWSVGKSVAEPLPRALRADRHRRVEAALSAAGLPDLDPRLLPGQLSGGQCQRVALARVQVHPPALLLADEPTSALDASVGAGILRLLRTIADHGTGIVLVSHDPAVLAALADRVFTLEESLLKEDTDD